MKTILHILKNAGGYRRDFSLRIENPPHPPLVMDAMDESGPCGLPALSVAQYGDALAVPEMYFELSNPLRLGLSLVPFYYRNDAVGIEQFSRSIDSDHYLFLPDLYAQHLKCAVEWSRNLDRQGFLAAFESARNRR